MRNPDEIFLAVTDSEWILCTDYRAAFISESV